MAIFRTSYTFYFLHDPNDENTGYVGMTTETIQKRMARHISEAVDRKHSPNSNKNVWIRELLDRGLRPYGKVLEVSGFVDGVQAGARESYWIKKMQEEGKVLVNMTEGSPGSPGLSLSHSEETRQLIGEKMKIYGEDVYEKVLSMRRGGSTVNEIVAETGISRSTYFKEMKPRIDQDLKRGTETESSEEA